MKVNLIATNEWFKGDHIIEQGGHYALAIYMILQKMQQMDGKIITSIGELIAYMMADRKNETLVSSVKGAIYFLAQEKFIVLYDDIHMTTTIVGDLKNAKIAQALYIKIGELPKVGYTQITVDELNTIMESKGLKAKKKVQMLCYFMAIVIHIDAKTKVAFPSLDSLRDIVGIRKESCKEFNEMLQDMGLIVYYNAGVLRIDGEGRVSNTYARAEHRAELETEIKRLRQTHRRNHSELEKYQIVDMKRSLKQKMNNLQHKEEIRELTMKEQKQLEKLQEQYNQLLNEQEML